MQSQAALAARPAAKDEKPEPNKSQSVSLTTAAVKVVSPKAAAPAATSSEKTGDPVATTTSVSSAPLSTTAPAKPASGVARNGAPALAATGAARAPTAIAGSDGGKGDPQKEEKTGEEHPAGKPKAKAAHPASGAWVRDFPAAQAKALAEKRDVLLLFDNTDRSDPSSRSTREMLLQKEFRQQLESQYELVLINLSERVVTKWSMAAQHGNAALAKQFRVRSLPTIIVTDAQGRTYGQVRGLQGDASALTAKLGELRTVRDRLERLISQAEHGTVSESLQAVREAIELLENQELIFYQQSLLEQWLAVVRRHDAANAHAVYERVFADWWLLRLTAIERPSAAWLRPLLDELDAWKREHIFQDADRAARLHLYAGSALLVVRDLDRAGKYLEAGLNYRPHDRKILNALKAMQMAAQGIMGSGTGFVVSADGYLLTNHHVVAGAQTLLVRLPDGKEPLPAKVVADAQKDDIALLKIDPPTGVHLRPLTVLSTEVGRGMPIGAFGYPLGGMVGVGLKLTTGIVSAPADQSPEGMILLDCRVNPGNSGGPLCDARGGVVGMITAKSYNSFSVDSYGMALPGSLLCDFLQKHLPGFPPRKSKTTVAAGQWDQVDRRVSPSVVLVLRGAPPVKWENSERSVGGSPRPNSAAGGGVVDLLKQIDLGRDVVQGEWTWEDGMLLTPPSGAQNRIQISLPLPPQYALRIVAERRSPGKGLNIGFVAGGSQAMVCVDGFRPCGTALECVDGESGSNNGTRIGGSRLPIGVPVEMLLRVRADSVEFDCAGKRVLRWSGAFDRLSLFERMWSVPDTKALVLGSQAQFLIRRYELVPVPPPAVTPSGAAKVPQH
jgi:S1-C subfamily serine protease